MLQHQLTSAWQQPCIMTSITVFVFAARYNNMEDDIHKTLQVIRERAAEVHKVIDLAREHIAAPDYSTAAGITLLEAKVCRYVSGDDNSTK